MTPEQYSAASVGDHAEKLVTALQVVLVHAFSESRDRLSLVSLVGLGPVTFARYR
jgi:hypothetical protein